MSRQLTRAGYLIFILIRLLYLSFELIELTSITGQSKDEPAGCMIYNTTTIIISTVLMVQNVPQFCDFVKFVFNMLFFTVILMDKNVSPSRDRMVL